MERVLLIGTYEHSWKAWIAQNAPRHDWISLDPLDTDHGPGGRFCLVRDGKVVRWCFYGSLNAQRAPHRVVECLAVLLAEARENVVVQLFGYRPGPTLRQLALSLAAVLGPTRIVIGQGTPIDKEMWPIGPEEALLEVAFPPLVRNAQRRARWLKMIEESREHEIPIKRVSFDGARFGSGTPIDPSRLARLGLTGIVHAEVCHKVLYLVSEQAIQDRALSAALDDTGAERGHVVSPAAFEGLVCAFARESGEDFGIGFVRKADFRSGVFHVANTAVPPAPVRLLRLGSLRIDESAKEFGEIRPWEI
ncbi:MAG: hypothetical protein SNJ61_01220 [Fimbriimonadaceae bacterium]